MRNGRARYEGERDPALGEVVRDAMDHAAIIVRDNVQIARLSVQRYVEHLRRDVSRRAIFGAATAVCALVAALSGMVALFFGLLWLTDSVGWAFLLFAVIFGVGAAVLAAIASRPARVESLEDIERRFPAVRMDEHRPAHALVRQESPAAHAVIVEEARRETRAADARREASLEDARRERHVVDGRREARFDDAHRETRLVDARRERQRF